MKPYHPTRFAGWLACFTLITYLLSVAGLVPADIAAVAAWLTLVIMLPAINGSARKQSAMLFTLGVIGLAAGYWQGADISWRSVFAANVPLLAMFVAITFLSLTNSPDSEERLPTGCKAAAITALGTTLLGAVINLSVIFVFGDRLQRGGTLTDAQQILLARCFTAAAWWSPFFIATGVALMYAPGMAWKATVAPGALMAMLGIIYTLVEVKYKSASQFEGYPLKAESLMIPLLMAVSVLTLHHFFPQIPIMLLISLLSVLGTLVCMRQRPRLLTLKDFVDNRLHTAGPQFALFLAAGVFSAGIKTVIDLHPDLIDLHQFSFDANMFAILLALMITAGLLGVHPVISIAVVSPVLLPLAPDPTSLGFLFLSTWAISTGSGPLSGIGLVLTGRYGASSRRIIRNNWHYVITMWVLASLLNWVLLA